MSTINIDTTVTTINILTTGQQGPSGPRGEQGPVGEIDSTIIDNLQNQITDVQTLAQTNDLKIGTKIDQVDFEAAQIQVESNRLAILTKADQQALSMLALLVDTKAEQAYVQQQIANLVGSAPEALNTIYELAAAIQSEQGLIDSLNQSVANRVRYDVANQALTEIQKENARTNVGAEKSGTAAQLVSQITATSIGAATAAQGAKADTALQSADVAPVALSGLFSSLGGQNKIFDVVFNTYALGTNAAITATDTLGQMLGKLQAQINNVGSGGVTWVDVKTIGTINSLINNSYTKIEVAKINGTLWLRGVIHFSGSSFTGTVFTVTHPSYRLTIKRPPVREDYMYYPTTSPTNIATFKVMQSTGVGFVNESYILVSPAGDIYGNTYYSFNSNMQYLVIPAAPIGQLLN